MTPQKIALCSAMRKQAKLTPKMMAKYLLLSPINIFKAIQVTDLPFLPFCRAQYGLGFWHETLFESVQYIGHHHR